MHDTQDACHPRHGDPRPVQALQGAWRAARQPATADRACGNGSAIDEEASRIAAEAHLLASSEVHPRNQNSSSMPRSSWTRYIRRRAAPSSSRSAFRAISCQSSSRQLSGKCQSGLRTVTMRPPSGVGNMPCKEPAIFRVPRGLAPWIRLSPAGCQRSACSVRTSSPQRSSSRPRWPRAMPGTCHSASATATA